MPAAKHLSSAPDASWREHRWAGRPDAPNRAQICSAPLHKVSIYQRPCTLSSGVALEGAAVSGGKSRGRVRALREGLVGGAEGGVTV